MRLILGLVVAAAFISACSGSGSDAAPRVTNATSASSSVPTIAATTTTSDPTTSTTAPESTSTSTTSTTASTTTTDATTTSTSTAISTTTAPTQSGGLVLTNNGIGPLRFGAKPEPAIEFLIGALGLPTDDSDWGPSFSQFGTCPGTEVRGVSYGPLTVLFGDPDGEREFYAWTYNAFASPELFGLTTPEGVGLGTPTAQALAAYPTTEIFPADEIFPATATLSGMFATFNDVGEIAHLGGGRLCGE